jgi:hypothetical protein
MHLKEIEWENVDGVNLDYGRNKWWAVVNAVTA